MLTKAVHELLGREFVAGAERLRVDTQKNVRFGAVAARCAEARKELGLDVKQVAARLRVPQYRVQAIERGRLREIRGAVLIGYVSFLGLDSWLRRWVRANSALASELGIDLRRSVPKHEAVLHGRRGTSDTTTETCRN
ncbi:MAG: helix-turn-helix domain-containing protein [bacterium]